MSNLIDHKAETISDYFGIRVFGLPAIRERLDAEAYADLERTVREGTALSLSTAEAVAGVMKEWALEHGATHYTHWFQPLTGATAEKHEAFLASPSPEGHTILAFSGKDLVMSEPDASSFPSGGLRATFEARGYTAWDCTSPAFLREDATGTILCIPTAFCSYTGYALDQKTPLLRSMQALDREGIRLLRLLGNTTSQHVVPYVGAEQEYFLIERAKYLRRKDLVYTGRTLFGTMPGLGQELADHYYHSIRERAGAFMNAVNRELWELGVPAKTQHNEVAPAQLEIVPLHSTANIAADQNQLIMETLKRIAARQDLACLLHEKPFEGINGSGKHNNWSVSTDDGINLFDPGRTPHENRNFLLALACVIKAVDEHADLLRAAAASAGNDCRLGGNEAPPAVISIFLGEQLTDVISQITAEGRATHSLGRSALSTGVSSLPVLSRDTTDRNRTSPFAFTGNRFEFRMVGSSDSLGCVNTVLNSITAEAFAEASAILEASDDVSEAAATIIRTFISEHKRVLWAGNSYSDEWKAEAARRGLPDLPTAVDAIPAICSAKSAAMFEKLGVFNRTELESRAEIRFETYSKQLIVESRTMLNIAHKHLIPAVIAYMKTLSESINQVRLVDPQIDTGTQQAILRSISGYLQEAGAAAVRLEAALNEAAAVPEIPEKAAALKERVLPEMKALRTPLDALEKIVDKKVWPFPSYGDMLFDV